MCCACIQHTTLHAGEAPSTEALCARGGVASSSGRGGGAAESRYRTKAPRAHKAKAPAPDQATSTEALVVRTSPTSGVLAYMPASYLYYAAFLTVRLH